MTPYSRGDVVLVNFMFSEGKGVKRRPSVVLSSDRYHKNRQEAIIAAVTSNVERLLVGDHSVSGWREAGLLYPSVVTGIIRTIKQPMIAGKLGKLGHEDLDSVSANLKDMLGLER